MNTESQPSAPSDSLIRLAARASADPWFFGSVLAGYQRRHQLDDAGLAAVLGCDVDTLTHLRLCRRPGLAVGWTVEEDLRTIAAACGIDPTALGQIQGITPQ